MNMNDNTKYTALTSLWTHHNSTQFQWPSIIIGSVFVAITILVDKDTISNLIDTNAWGNDGAVQYGCALPLLFIGIGIMAMLYTMARARKIMGNIEDEINKIDNSFITMNHPNGFSGAKLIWRFMAFIAFFTSVFGSFLLCGLSWVVILPLFITIVPWAATCWYGW